GQLTLGFQLSGRTNARISAPFNQQLFDFIFIEIVTLRLVERTFIVVEFEPFHGLQNGLDCLRCGSFTLGVFDAQDKFAPAMSCKKVIKQSGPSSTNVQIPCWARCKSRSDRIHFAKLTGGQKSVNAALTCELIMLI